MDLMEKVPQGAGSGTIWDTDGHVVTNAHVIAGASDLQVRCLLTERADAGKFGNAWEAKLPAHLMFLPGPATQQREHYRGGKG